MRRAFSFLLASLLGLTILSCCQTTHYNRLAANHSEMHPALQVIDVFIPAETYQRVIPYEVNLYGISIFQQNLNWRDVEQYILWYFDHLNYPDAHGLTGSIYDYLQDNNGGLSSTKTYDSADAYAATFLMLLHAYYQKVGNRQILNYYKKKIEDIARLIIRLKDSDGLTFAVPYLQAKYLMDNCEVYAGLKAYVSLARKLDWPISDIYHTAIAEIHQGIRTQLYDPARGTFHWARQGHTVHPSYWHRFYPDAFAQLFPIIYELVDPLSPEARRIWDSFHSRYQMGEGLADHLQSLLISMARDRVYMTAVKGTN